MTHRAHAAGLGMLGILGLALAFALPGPLGWVPVVAPASAHNSVISTTPSAGETLTALPASFEIRTSDALLDLGKSAFVIQDAAGLYYGDGCTRVVGASMFTDAAVGAAGTYTITWQVVSADGHTIDGSFTFKWAPAAPGDDPVVGSAAAPSCGSGEPTPVATETGSPGTDSGGSGISSDVWWISGAALAILVAVIVTILATRRRDPAK